MISKAIKRSNTINGPEVRPQLSNVFKIIETKSNTSLSDKEINELDKKETRAIPYILSKNLASSGPSINPAISNMRSNVETQYLTGLDFEDKSFKPSDVGRLVTRRFINGYSALMLTDPCADINHMSEDFC